MSIPNAPYGLLGNAPMQTQLVDNQRSVTPPWGGWLNWLRQWLFLNIPTIVTNASGVSSSANPIANGAFGDGIHDDTAIVQQTINQNGILYLPPEKTFKVTSTITLPNTPFLVYIWGGGEISSSATPALSLSGGVTNLIVENVVIIATPGVGISVATNTSQWVEFHNIYLSVSTTCIALNSDSAQSIRISDCVFTGVTGVALTTQTDVLISNCQFRGSTTPVSTSGTCTYNLVGCNVPPHFGAPVLKQYAEFTGTTQTFTAGAGFAAVTSCTFTITATGTWMISANALVQQASAAANSATIRFTRNSVGDSHNAASGAGPTAEFMLHFDCQIALTSGDTIVLQCSAVGANASLLGTGNTGTTNISGVFLGT